MATKSKRARERRIAEIRTNGGIVPIGIFDQGGMGAERVAQKAAHGRSGAAGTHADSNARRNAPGTYRTNRVGSRSSQRRAAIRDWA